MGVMAATALTIHKGPVKTEPALFIGNVIVAGETESFFGTYKEFLLRCAVRSMTSHTTSGCGRGVDNRSLAVFFPGMASKAEGFRFRLKQRFSLRTMAVMTGETIPLNSRCVAAYRVLFLHSSMAFDADGFGRFVQHEVIVTGMRGMTGAALFVFVWRMELLVFFKLMAGKAKDIRLVNKPYSISCQGVTGIAFSFGNRRMDGLFEQSFIVGAVGCVAEIAIPFHGVIIVVLPEG